MRERAKTLVEAHLSAICERAGVEGPSIDGLMEMCDADHNIALIVTRSLSLETDQEMIAHLTVDAAKAAQQSEKHAAKANEIAANASKVARQSNRLSIWSLVIAAISVVLSVILRFS